MLDPRFYREHQAEIDKAAREGRIINDRKPVTAMRAWPQLQMGQTGRTISTTPAPPPMKSGRDFSKLSR